MTEKLLLFKSSQCQEGSLVAIGDELSDLKNANSVIESYAQLVSQTPNESHVSFEQIGNFLFIMHERQARIINKIETYLKG